MKNRTSPDTLGAGKLPEIDFFWKEVGGKRRLIGNPNKAMRILHQTIGRQILQSVISSGKDGYGVRKLPSATGCVAKSNPTINARRHMQGKFFYITDLKDAYPSVDLERLALILVFLSDAAKYGVDMSLLFFADDSRKESLRETSLFRETLALLQCNFAGLYGKGLAVGGPLSPYLMNLYCEVYLDASMRRLCEKRKFVYTRYVDDLTFSSMRVITQTERGYIRQCIHTAGFEVNHRKSRVLALSQGTVFVTKVGLEQQPLEDSARIVFPQKKRRKLHGIIGSYLKGQMDWPEKVSGFVAEFLYYYKIVPEKTASDRKTFALCKAFEAEWSKYKDGPAVSNKY